MDLESLVSGDSWWGDEEPDEGEEEAPEMKYVPPDSPPSPYNSSSFAEDVPIKEERIDEEERQLIEQYLQREEAESDDDWKPSTTSSQKKKITRKRHKQSPEERREAIRLSQKRRRERMKELGIKEPKRNRPRVAQMTPEQAEKQRENARLHRLRVKLQREDAERSCTTSGDDGSTFGDLIPEMKEESNRSKVDNCSKAPRKRKRVADMTPEQREKERQRLREYRKRQKLLREAPIKTEPDDNSDDGASKAKISRRLADLTPDQAARERERTVQRRQKEREEREALKAQIATESDHLKKQELEAQLMSLGVSQGYRRKRISDMTPEEAAKMRERWREDRKLRRLREAERRGKTITPQKPKKVVGIFQKGEGGVRKRISRSLANEGLLSAETIKAIEAERARDRERRRRQRASMTPEQKKEYYRQMAINRQMKRAAMTEEEKKEERERKYFARVAKEAQMTPEEREEKRRQMRERRTKLQNGKRNYERKMNKYGREQLREQSRRWWREMSPTRKARTLERLRECYRQRMEKLREDPERWAEFRQKSREREKQSKQRLKLGLAKRRWRSGVPPTITNPQHPKNWKKEREHNSALTPEEKEARKRRQAELRRVRDRRKTLLKKLDYYQKLLDSGLTLAQIYQRTETPAQRERRCMRVRINKAKQQLRNTLQNVGLSVEEIQKRVDQVPETYTPSYPIRDYKPRPERRRVVLGTEKIEEIRRELEMLEAKEREIRERESKEPINTEKEIKTVEPLTIPSVPLSQQSSTSAYYSPLHWNHPPPPPQLEPPRHSLQTLMESVSYTPQVAPLPLPYTESSASSSQDYQYGDSSHFDDDAPLSPGGYYGDNHSESNSYQQQPQFAAPPPTQPCAPSTTRKRGRKPKIPEESSSSVYITKRPGRQARPGVPLTSVCDLCGKGFTNADGLRAHKRHYHHPSYNPEKHQCLICHQTFRRPHLWYTHYRLTHVLPTVSPRPNGFVCDTCGAVLANKLSLDNHHHFQHGAGTNPQNYITCHLCPGGERQFKSKVTYHSHLQRCHPDYQRGGHDCFRCAQSFHSDRTLGAHVRQNHPDSYFPCPYCTACKFTQMGLHFHFDRCKPLLRISGERKRLEGEWKGEVFTLERMLVSCEFCERKVILSSLTRHYKEMHKVVEDPWKCDKCGKSFKRRPFWVNHLEEKHQKNLEELKMFVHKLNAVDREGLKVTPVKGGSGRKTGWKQWEEKQGKPRKGRKKMVRRNVMVICEEDDQVKQEVLSGSEEEISSNSSDSEEESESESESSSRSYSSQ